MLAGELNGVDLAEQARVICPDLKVLVTSGYAPENVLRRLDVSAEHLRKPYTINLLELRIRAMLAA